LLAVVAVAKVEDRVAAVLVDIEHLLLGGLFIRR
jgi:hypothetical protein